MQEREIKYLEEHIPELAESAVTQAYWQSLAAGHWPVKERGIKSLAASGVQEWKEGEENST